MYWAKSVKICWKSLKTAAYRYFGLIAFKIDIGRAWILKLFEYSSLSALTIVLISHMQVGNDDIAEVTEFDA